MSCSFAFSASNRHSSDTCGIQLHGHWPRSEFLKLIAEAANSSQVKGAGVSKSSPSTGHCLAPDAPERTNQPRFTLILKDGGRPCATRDIRKRRK
jgi:hypothetical protein